MADPLEEDIKRPYKPRLNFGVGMSSPESRDRLYESYRIASSPLVEAEKKFKQERLERRQQKLNFELGKLTLKDRQLESQTNRDLLKADPSLANELGQITEDFKDDPAGGQAALMRFTADNSLALSKNSALNTQVRIQNSFFERKIAEKKDEERRTEDLNLARALSYHRLGKVEKSNEYFERLTNPESIKSFEIGVELQQQAAAKDAADRSKAEQETFKDKQSLFGNFVEDLDTAVKGIPPKAPPIPFSGGDSKVAPPEPETLFDRIERAEGRTTIYFALERALRLFPDEFKEYQGRDMRDVLKEPEGELFLQKAYNKLNVAVLEGRTGTPAARPNPVNAGE
tara:strand:+ start:1469 stop:2494 length:1026 start_codon:yes stop_codon:yes gene_type:complete